MTKVLSQARLRNAAGPVIIAALGMSVFLGWSLVRFGSVGSAVAYLNGHRVQPVDTLVAVGEVSVGAEASAVFRLRNLASYPITVLGAKADCGCMATDDLPVTLAPHVVSNVTLRFTTREREAGKLIRHSALLCLDVDSAPVYLIASAMVLPTEGVEPGARD